MRQKQKQTNQMNTLQCEVCVQQLSAETASDPATSLLKASEAAEMLYPVYVYCQDCKQHLCKPCDYRAHVHHSRPSSSKDQTDSSKSGRDNDQISSETQSASQNEMQSQSIFTKSQQNTQSHLYQLSAEEKMRSAPKMSEKTQKSTKESQSQQNNNSNKQSTEETKQEFLEQVILNHSRFQICEECTAQQSCQLCTKCEQSLCQICWVKIHNKAARRRHKPKPLVKPLFYPPQMWKKTSSMTQQSAGSSSLSQFKHGQETDEINEALIFDNEGRPSLLSSLKVDLDSEQKSFCPQQQQQQPHSLLKHSHPGDQIEQQPPHYDPRFGMQPPNFEFKMENFQKYPEYGQSPQYVHQMQPGHMPLNAAPFNPGMNINQRQGQTQVGQHKIQMIPQYTAGPGYHHPQGTPIYFYPDQNQIPRQFVGLDPYGRQFHQHQVGPQPMYPGQMNQMVPVDQTPYGRQPAYANQRHHISEFVPNFRSKSNQKSEDDSHSTGIHEEATHQLPQAYDLSRARQTSGKDQFGINQGRKHEIGSADDAAHVYNLEQNSHETRQNQLFSQSESSVNSVKNIPTGVFRNPETGKSFTPLRRVQQQNSSDCIASPLLSTPIEQNRNESYGISKLLTPPITLGGQNRSNLKIKPGASNAQGQYVAKGNKPLKVPRGQTYGQGSLFAGKPPIASYEKKGPHIQYQVKTGKPNSMSSHEMDSDSGYGFQSGNQIKRSQFVGGAQKSFDAYQLYPHPSSQSAKNNYRNQQLASRGKPDLQSHEHSPESHDSHKSGQFSNRNAEPQHIRGSIDSSSINVDSNYEKRQYKLKTKEKTQRYQGDISATGSDRPLNSSYGCKYDSQSSASKPGSLSNQKSGSAGKQGSGTSNPTQRVAAANLRAATSGSNQEGLVERKGSSLQRIQIFQPVIQLDRKSFAANRSSLEESKSSEYVQHSEENKLLQIMQLVLFQNAAQGDLLVLKKNFMDKIMAQMKGLNPNKLISSIDRAVNQGIIHQTDRNFADSKTIEFISLKIQVLSHQCLQWVITSLRRDEMTPTESAIKNRTKEAFDFKLQNDCWEAIVRSIKNQEPLKDSDRHQQPLSNSSQNFVKQQSITPPDQGSSAHTQGYVARNVVASNSSFSQSSVSSTNQQPLTATTTTTISAKGITKITLKQSVVTEADSGSTIRNQALGSRSLGGPNTGSGTDSHDKNEAYQANMAASQNNLNTNNVHHTSSSGTTTKSNQDSTAVQDGAVVRSNDQKSDAPPRFKVVVQQQSKDDSGCSASGASSAGIIQAIYMEDEEAWQGIDIEDDSTVDQELYQLIISFLKDYFCQGNTSQADQISTKNQDQSKDSDSQLRLEDFKDSQDSTLQSSDLRMIPGGRYGCTQFLKICGPDGIRNCSVGKITQMVQLAIKEDILRHLKTQIVWSTQVDKHKTEQDTFEDQQIMVQRKAKLQKVKEAIIEILAESKTGMSLAQLPQYLKKKLPFNLEWNELGFPKLKDLLKSMEDHIKVELRDVNHPFAFLVHKKKNKQSLSQAKTSIDQDLFQRNSAISEQMQDGSTRQMVYCSEKLQQVVQAVFTLLQMEPCGVKENDLGQLMQKQLNFEFKKEDLGCGSLYEFVQKYIMPHDDSIEFITLPENGKKSFMFRSNKFLSKFCIDMRKQEQMMQLTSQNLQNRQAQIGYYPGSMSHKNFNRGHQGKNDSSQIQPSDISCEYARNVQTQPNDLLPHFHPQFPTDESIIGGSQCSSMKNADKVISDLCIDLESQQQAITPPFTQQAQKIPDQRNMNASAHAQWLQQMQQTPNSKQPQYYPWLPTQQMNLAKTNQANQQYRNHQGMSSEILDNVQINPNFHLPGVPVGQTLHENQLVPFYHMPIDQMDCEGDKQRLAVQQQSSAQPQLNQDYQHLNFNEIDSPRIHHAMQALFEETTPNGPYNNTAAYPQQNMIDNANGSEFDTQYNHFSEHIMNQSIFSEPLEKPSRKIGLNQNAADISLDVNVETDACSQQEVYCPLLSAKQLDDKVTLNSWHANLPLSNKLDKRMRPSEGRLFTMLQTNQPKDKDERQQQPRITEETSGSQPSSNHHSPAQGEVEKN